MTHWKRLWCWEGLGAGGKGDDRGWDGWMASPTQWTWVWVNSRRLVMDKEAWSAVIHGVTKSRTLLSDWTDWLTDWFIPIDKDSNSWYTQILFYFVLSIFLNWKIIALQRCIGFCWQQHTPAISVCVYVCISLSSGASLPPPHTTPLGPPSHSPISPL